MLCVNCASIDDVSEMEEGGTGMAVVGIIAVVQDEAQLGEELGAMQQ